MDEFHHRLERPTHGSCCSVRGALNEVLPPQNCMSLREQQDHQQMLLLLLRPPLPSPRTAFSRVSIVLPQ
jgi:hypothetical protein